MSEGRAPEHGGAPGASGGRPGGSGGQPQPGGPGSQAAGPGALLSDLARLRRRTRAARHAYWFPLLLFGLLTCAAAPLYVAAQAMPGRSGSFTVSNTGPVILGGMASGPNGFYLGWYWAVALTCGYLLTVLWYRRHARQAGVRPLSLLHLPQPTRPERVSYARLRL